MWRLFSSSSDQFHNVQAPILGKQATGEFDLSKNDQLSDLFERAILSMEVVLDELANAVPPPKIETIRNGQVFRFAEKTLQQAIVQKLARIISALHASEVLLNTGFVQELGALQRQIDESNEDVFFLVLGSREDILPKRHRVFLDAFYAEEIIGGELAGIPRTSKAEVPRKKIRAYIAENSGPGINPSLMIDNGKALYGAYSGFVHGASPNIMGMYGGNPAKFHVRGMNGTPASGEFRAGMFVYHYRSFMAFCMAPIAFDLLLNEGMKQLLDEFDRFHATDF